MTSVSNPNLPAIPFDLQGVNYQVGQENWQRKGILGKLFGTGEKIIIEVKHSREHTIDFTIKTYTQNFWQRIGSLFSQAELRSEKKPGIFKQITINESECKEIGYFRRFKVKNRDELKQDLRVYSHIEKSFLQTFLNNSQNNFSEEKINDKVKAGFITAIGEMFTIHKAIRNIAGDRFETEVPIATTRSVDQVITQALKSKWGPGSLPADEIKENPSASHTQSEVKSIIETTFGADLLPAAETQENFPIAPFRAFDDKGQALFAARRDIPVIIERMEILAQPYLKSVPLEKNRDAFLDILDGIIRENFGQVLDLRTLKRVGDENNFKQILAEHLDKIIPKQFTSRNFVALEHVPEDKMQAKVLLDPEFFYEVAVPGESLRLIAEIGEFLSEHDLREVKSSSNMALQLAQNLPIADAFSRYAKELKAQGENLNVLAQRKISELAVGENNAFLRTVQKLTDRGFSASTMQEVIDQEFQVVKKELLGNLAEHQKMLQKALQEVPQKLKDTEIFDATFLDKGEQLVDELGVLGEEYEEPVLRGWAGKRVRSVADLNKESLKPYAKTVEEAMKEARAILRNIRNTLIVSQQYENAKEIAVKKHSQLMLAGHYSQAYALTIEMRRSEANFKKFARNHNVSKMAAESHHLTNVVDKLFTNAKPLPLPLQLSEIGDETSPEATALVSAFTQQQETKIQQFLMHIQEEFRQFSLSDHSLLKLNAEGQEKLRKLIQAQIAGMPPVPREFPRDNLVHEMQAFEDSVDASMQRATNEIEKLIDLHFYLPATEAVSESKEPRRVLVADAMEVKETTMQIAKVSSHLQRDLTNTLSEFEGMIAQFEKFSRDFPNVQSAGAANVLHKMVDGREILGKIMQRIVEKNLTDEQIRSDEGFIPIAEYISSIVVEGRKMAKTQRRYIESRARFDQSREKVKAKINALGSKPVPELAFSYQLRMLLKNTEKDYAANSKQIQKLSMFFNKAADLLEERLMNLETHQRQIGVFQQLDEVPADSIEADLIKEAFVRRERDELMASEESIASLRREPFTVESMTFNFSLPEVKPSVSPTLSSFPQSPKALTTPQLVKLLNEVSDRLLALEVEANSIAEQRQRLRETIASYKTKLQFVENSLEEMRDRGQYVVADKHAQLLAPLKALTRKGDHAGSIEDIHTSFGTAIKNLDRIQQAVLRDQSVQQTLLQQLQNPNLTLQLREVIANQFRLEQRAIVTRAQALKNELTLKLENMRKSISRHNTTPLQIDIVALQERLSLALLTSSEFNKYIASGSIADLVLAKELADEMTTELAKTVRSIDLPNMQRLLKEYKNQRKRAFDLVNKLEPQAAARLKAQIDEIHENFNFLKRQVGFEDFRKALASREGPIQMLTKAIKQTTM